MKMILIFLTLFSGNVIARELDFTTYLKLQNTLASDDFKASLNHHKTICDKELSQMKVAYKDCGKKFKDIEELRTSFKQLSAVYLEKGNKDELKGLHKFSCPMANAKWVQKESNMRNPYYGKSMLECGEKI